MNPAPSIVVENDVAKASPAAPLNAFQLVVLRGLQRKTHIYSGSVPYAVKAANRAANKAGRKSRRLNRRSK